MESRPLNNPQRQMLWTRLLIRLLIFAGVVLFLLLLGRQVLSLCMPFLLALAFTWLTEPAMKFIHSRWKIPRGILSLLFLLLVVGALGGVIAALVWKGWQEISALWANWEDLWETFRSVYLQLSQTMEGWLSLLPSSVQSVVHDLSDRLLSWLHTAVSTLVPKTTSAARSISSFVLAFLFFLMACYFTAADYPNLRARAAKKTPASLRRVWDQLRRAFSAAFGGYLKAEATVSLGVMVILLIGFGLIRQPYWVLMAVLLAVLDFIPILGAGTVLIPWAVILLILGSWKRGLYLLLVWGIICLFRRFLEPKIVGDQTGLHPLLSLLAIYVGMKLAGVAGMILGPVLVLMFRNLWRAGMFRDTARDLVQAGQDLYAILHTGREEEKN